MSSKQKEEMEMKNKEKEEKIREAQKVIYKQTGTFFRYNYGGCFLFE